MWQILIDENASGGIPKQEYRRLLYTVDMNLEQMLMFGKEAENKDKR